MAGKMRFTIRIKLAILSTVSIGAAVSILGIFLGLSFRDSAFNTAEATLDHVSTNARFALDHTVSSVETSMNLLANQIGYNTDFANSIETVSTDAGSLKNIRTAISGKDGSGDGSTIAGAMDYLVVSESAIRSATMYSPFVDSPILSRLYPTSQSKVSFTEETYNKLIAHPGRALWFFQNEGTKEALYVWKALVNFGVTDNFDMKVVGYVEYEFDKEGLLHSITDTKYNNEGMLLLDENSKIVYSADSGQADVDEKIRANLGSFK